MCSAILNDHITYRRLLHGEPIPYAHLIAALRTTLQTHGKLYDRHNPGKLSQLATFILQSTLKSEPALFYCLPKLHKPFSSPVAPGRPIVSSIPYITYNASRYIDLILQPYMIRSFSYIKDSTDLLLLAETTQLSQSCVIGVADYTNLYPSIVQSDGLHQLRRALVTLQLKPSQIEFILALTSFILQNNYFAFGNDFFHQLLGTAMGTPLAVTFACLYLTMLEWDVFKFCKLHNPFWTPPTIYKRHIDDIFSTFDSKEDALFFFKTLNSSSSLKLTYDVNLIEGIHQDLKFYKGTRFIATGILDVTIYQKPTNKYQYIPFSSYHPLYVFKSLIHGELRRYTLACSNHANLTRIISEFKTRLHERAYTLPFLDLCFQRLPHRHSLISLLRLKRKPTPQQLPTDISPFSPTSLNPPHQSTQSPLIFSIPYSNRIPSHSLKRCLQPPPTLEENPDTCGIIPPSGPILCNKRNRNLKDRLVHTKLNY